MRTFFTACMLVLAGAAAAQNDTTEVFDYSQFGDAEGVKRYCTQKVLNQTPQRIISVGFEHHGSYAMPSVPLSPMLPAMQDFTVNRVSALRLQVNVPVVSNSKIIWQLGANYWGSRFNIENPGTNAFAKRLNDGMMTTAGINTTVFKPLNEKNFMIFQASADMNGVAEGFDFMQGKALTLSGILLYGWKTSEKNMIGTGIARTYRAGQILHVPVLLWNRTFNDRWGMELLLPARGYLRRNFSTSSMLQLGFELEGNQFRMAQMGIVNNDVFVQRGELKPRIMWDKKISGFLWFNVQAGLRYNWRFDVMNEYDGKKDSQLYFRSNLGNPLFFNFSLNFVSP
ncbi:MAG: hypothetical protein FJX94_04185 [Bacteroidetes bacterium]|nr:hypothetical protein [Bacteroidota bacterium]